MTVDQPFVLVVIPEDEMRNLLTDAFQEYGCPFAYTVVSTVRAAQEVLRQNHVQAILMTKSAALAGDESTDGLITLYAKELPPAVTVLQKEDGYPEYLYLPDATHDWMTVPFDLQELYTRISGVIRRANK